MGNKSKLKKTKTTETEDGEQDPGLHVGPTIRRPALPETEEGIEKRFLWFCDTRWVFWPKQATLPGEAGQAARPGKRVDDNENPCNKRPPGGYAPDESKGRFARHLYLNLH